MPSDPLKQAQITQLRAQLIAQQQDLTESLHNADATTKPVTLDQQSVGRVSRIDAIQQQQMAIANQQQTSEMLTVIELTPPETRFWSVTLESVWHECLEPRRRPSSITKARASVQPDDSVRLVIAGSDPGTDNWLDTGGRTRGFMTFRWLDNLAPPSVTTRVVPLAECNGSRAGGS